MPLHGYLDLYTADVIAGWAWNSDDPEQRLIVEILVDGKPVMYVPAHQYREDLKIAGIGDGTYGFRYIPPTPFDLRQQTVSVTIAGTHFHLQAPETTSPARTSHPPVNCAQMDRVRELRGSITPDQLGIEIGPWFNPIVPKSKGYHSLALDIYDTDSLRERARKDPGIPDERIREIEEVDLLGHAMNLAELVQARGLTARIDYIISSHNFEHLPNPIRFLQACATVLRPGGLLSMAIPDRRACFDYFRPHSTTGDLLDAFWESRERPTPGQLFTYESLHAYNRIDGADRSAWPITSDPTYIRVVGNLETAFSHALLERTNPGIYTDAHCWAFTPASFEWVITDLQVLGLMRMQIRTISGTNGHEFFVHLINDTSTTSSPDSSFAQKRTELLHRVNKEAAS